MAIHIFQRLVSSALLLMKKASCAYCVLVFVSSGEPAALPGVSESRVTGGSGTEFVVGRTTSSEEGADVTMIDPMDHKLGMG